MGSVLFNYYNSQKKIFLQSLYIDLYFVRAWLSFRFKRVGGELSELNHFQKSYKRVHYHIFLIYNGKTPNYFKNSIEKSWKMWLLNFQFWTSNSKLPKRSRVIISQIYIFDIHSNKRKFMKNWFMVASVINEEKVQKVQKTFWSSGLEWSKILWLALNEK